MSKEGKGFDQGDFVRVRTDLQKGTIQWEVNGEMEASKLMCELKDKKIQWVPFVEMKFIGDQIEWVD